MVGRAVGSAVVVSLIVVAIEAVYRLYPNYFFPLVAVGLVLTLFYRKLDRIEIALSEERRRERFQRSRAPAKWMLPQVFVFVIVVGFGSYAVWTWF